MGMTARIELTTDEKEHRLKLREWGAWAASGEPDLGYSTMMTITPKISSLQWFTDDEGMRLDAEIGRLKGQNWSVIIGIYKNHMTYDAIAGMLGIGRSTVGDIRDRAIKELYENIIVPPRKQLDTTGAKGVRYA